MYLCIMYLEILHDVVLCVDIFVFIIAYLVTCVVDDVIYMCFIISIILMYALMRLCSLLIYDLGHCT